MEHLAEYAIFLAKLVTLLLAVLVVIAAIAGRMQRGQSGAPSPGSLEVRKLNEDYRRAAMTIKANLLPGKQFKAERKAEKARRKQQAADKRARLWVLDFHGDIRASALTGLREEITALLTTASEDDEVLVRLESAGGQVHAYGLAAAQLMRIRDRNIRLTVSVDKIAASGGYMMACVADRIIAAPFAILGSIGVIAQLPNFNRWLKERDIEYEQFMAGEHKRTVTLFGENTEEGRSKFQEEIEDVHALFKEFVGTHRPQVDLDEIATGEYWLGTRAIDHKLADELITSDDYLLKASEQADLFHLRWTGKQPWLARMLSQTANALVR
ncbi:protease SohB [Wenzhouxiangella sp. AB-CW3]|uniref:protease SohB n=1 Tax=Wenzhouxiangella sp. AB-CW3 TaxID=2771012 RepID=UPI00168C010D|nr:protease SohB [Wenzhouxiangella sp. AB-CW3]QOC23462.1 protease SohB [Wenzhouxiangella sp. AB-CW3]